MTIRFRLFAALSFASLLPAAASGATLTPEQGTVTVNNGRGFVAVTRAVPIQAGTRIMIAPGGAASVDYAAACTVRLTPGRVWTVPAEAPCLPGQRVVDFGNRMNQGLPPNASGWSPTVTPGQPPITAPFQPPAVVPPPVPVFPVPLVVTGVVVGGAVVAGAVAISSAQGSDTPSSP